MSPLLLPLRLLEIKYLKKVKQSKTNSIDNVLNLVLGGESLIKKNLISNKNVNQTVHPIGHQVYGA